MDYLRKFILKSKNFCSFILVNFHFFFADSEKENIINCTNIQNTTDIQSYELVIERDLTRPLNCNESINRIIKTLPALNKPCLSPVFKTPVRYKRNRLTHNVNSPLLKTSPLCSTPFKEKYRGQSIYRFSPITGRLSSPNMSVIIDKHTNKNNIIVEDETKTTINTTPVTLAEANNCDSKHCQRKTTTFDHHENISNIENLSNKIVTPSICKETKSSFEFTNAEFENKTEHKILCNTTQNMNDVANESEYCSYIHQAQTCTLDNTEAEPFLGFTDIGNENNSQAHELENVKIFFNKYNNDIDKDSFPVKSINNSVENDMTHYKNISHHKNKTAKNSEIHISSVSNILSNCNEVSDHKIQSVYEKSSYDTCESESDGNEIKTPIVLLNKLNDSILKKYYKNDNESNTTSKSKILLTYEFSKSVSNDSSSYSEIDTSGLNEISLSSQNERRNILSEKKKSHNNTFEEKNNFFRKKFRSGESKQSSESDGCGPENSIAGSLDDENTEILYTFVKNKKLYDSTNEKNNCVFKDNTSYRSNFSKCDTNEEVDTSQINESTETVNDSYTSQCDSTRNISTSTESYTSSILSNDENDSNVLSDDNNIKSSDEDKCVNFVTTRRKNRTNSLCMSIYSNSIDSNSLSISMECEKTVISNKLSFDKDSYADNTINRQSLNSTCHEDQNIPRTSNSNSNKRVRRSSIKARNSRKSRLSNTQHHNIINIDSPESSDRTNDENEDDTNATLYKITPNNLVNTDNVKIGNKSTYYETPNCSSYIKVDMVCASKQTSQTSDSDVITVTETDSDDINTILKNKRSSLSRSDKSKISDVSESETKDTVSEIIRHTNKYRNTVRYTHFNNQQSSLVARKSQSRDYNKTVSPNRFTLNEKDTTHGIVLQPGKKWERSLSIYRRMSMMGDFDVSLLDEGIEKKGRKYRESVINTMEMQECKGIISFFYLFCQTSFFQVVLTLLWNL